MRNEFSRSQILLGASSMEKLKNSRVAVFGLGGPATGPHPPSPGAPGRF